MPLPVMLDVNARRCLILGGGKVGKRKARQLKAEGAEVIVVSRSFPVEKVPGVDYREGIYTPALLDEIKPWLVVAATNEEATNRQIHTDAQARGCLTMVVSETDLAELKGIMQREKGGITFMIATGSPLTSRLLLEQALELVTPAVATFAAWQRTLRPIAKEIIPVQAERAALWRRVHESEVLDLLEAGDEAAARALMAEILGPELAQHM